MEEIVDKLIVEMDTVRDTVDFNAVMQIHTDTHWDDPGLVIVDEYPYIYVAPVSETPKAETMGMRGYDIRLNEIQIGVVVNAADYFDPAVTESPASRELVQASNLIRKHLRRLGKRNLDGMAGVRNLVVQSINYVPDVRDNTFVKVAVITVIVERQYQHEE
jgi:hypothetical protein